MSASEKLKRWADTPRTEVAAVALDALSNALPGGDE